MGSKRTNLQRPPSSDSSSSSSSSEEEQAASPPPAKKPTLNSTSPKTKPSKPPQPPSPDDEEDEDGEPPVSQKKDKKKKKEVAVKKDEKKNEEEEESSDEEDSSSDEEEEKQQEEEEEDDDDESSGTSDDEKKQLSKKPDSMAISASGSDSDSDSDSEPSKKPALAGIVTPAASGTKRPRDSGPSEQNTGKKKLFQRIWGADDETKILKGIIAFYSDKGLEPPPKAAFGADLDAIHSLLKKSLGLEFSKVQLGTKIRNIKRKFQTSASRCKDNTNPEFSKPQQQEIYELSKKIWRPENPNESRKSSGKSVKSKGKPSTLKVLKDQEEVDIPEGDSSYEFMLKAVAQAGHGDFSWSLIKRGLKLVDPEKARPLEKRLRELELARLRHGLQWLDKREEATQLIIDSIAKSG